MQCKVSEPEQAELGLVMGWRISKTTARITLSKGPSFSNFWQLLAMFVNYWQWSGNIWQFWLTFSYIWQRLENFVMSPLRQVIMSPCHLIILAACQLSACQSTCICFSACAYWSSQLVWTNTNWMQKGNNFMSFWNIWKKNHKKSSMNVDRNPQTTKKSTPITQCVKHSICWLGLWNKFDESLQLMQAPPGQLFRMALLCQLCNTNQYLSLQSVFCTSLLFFKWSGFLCGGSGMIWILYLLNKKFKREKRNKNLKRKAT